MRFSLDYFQKGCKPEVCQPRVSEASPGVQTKKNMKKTILLIIIITGLSTANAQMYNFLGNHVILNMEGYFSPAWFNPNPVSTGWDIPEGAKRYLGLNYFLSPSVELMVWKKGTVGAGYNYYNSPFKGTDYRVQMYDGYWGYNDYGELYGNITAHGFNVYYKQYLGDGFAPLGHHFKFTFDGYFYHYQMDTEGKQFRISSDVPVEEREAIFDNKGCLFGIKAEYGYDLVVFNRLKLTFGASIGTTFGGYRAPSARIRDELPMFDIGDRPHEPLTYNDYARGRILGAYWFGVKLGVGFIAF